MYENYCRRKLGFFLLFGKKQRLLLTHSGMPQPDKNYKGELP